MIIYFADRQLNIIGQASTKLPKGLRVVDDNKTEEVETGVSVFECKIPFTEDTRSEAEEITALGNHIIMKTDDEDKLYTIIESESDSKSQDVYIYAEDDGMDLLNEIVGAYEADKAYNIAHYINMYAADAGFVIGINEVSNLTRKLSWDGESTATARIASVATQFDGCEVSYSFEIDGLNVVKKYINIYKERGKDVGVTLRLNKEVDRIITTKSIANLATALQCTGGTPEDTNLDDDIEPVPITLKGYSYDDGDFYVDSDGILKSRKALEKWSRFLWKTDDSALSGGHITKQYSYDTLSQQTLCSRSITELKKICDMEVNYEADITKFPDSVKIGDRINIVDDAGELYLSTRVLKLESSETNQERKAIFGEHLIKSGGISQKVADLAAQFAAQAAANKKARLEALRAAQQAEAEAEAARLAAEEAAQKAAQAEADLLAAQQAAEEAQRIADEAQAQAEAAERAAAQAEADAADANAALKVAQSAAETATSTAEEAKTKAETALNDATTAKTTADAAKLDAEKAKQDIASLGDELETVSHTMQADYARKTDLTEAEASLQSQITQNAGQISSTVSQLSKINETANNAQEQAQAAQTAAEAAKSTADKATEDAQTAKTAADSAAQAATNAQAQADTAKAAADSAQKAADDADAKAAQAASDLSKAQQNLANVTSRVDATEDEIAAAQAAVVTAQAAADKAKADAVTAQSIANTAKDTAATAQTVANNAKTAADNAQAAADEAQQAAENAQAAVDALAVRVTTAETKITQNSEQIALRATKTEVTQTLGGYYTKAQTDAAITTKANEITSSVRQEITAIEVGGRNLLLNTGGGGEIVIDGGSMASASVSSWTNENGVLTLNCSATTTEIYYRFMNPSNSINNLYDLVSGKAYTLSGKAKVNTTSGTLTSFDVRTQAYLLGGWSGGKRAVITASDTEDFVDFAVTFTIEANATGYYVSLQLYYSGSWNGTIQVKDLKLEKGNKATDWTPAPEDVEEDIDYASESAKSAQEKADANATRVSTAESTIQQLANSIAALVRDGNGGSLIQQDSSGLWYFNIGGLEKSVSDTANGLNDLSGIVLTANGEIDVLKSTALALQQRTEYVRSYTDENGQPCLELGEGDSVFKVRITNTEIQFAEGTYVPAKLNRKMLVIEKSMVKGELQFGDDKEVSGVWIWKRRENGNLGLSWNEVSS